ncbi:uncharacterized protein [Dermacentor andersoni]|uniref:uncharacterized protein n=1 Tax=Dermacentor andersoni TaxID=34620 RepID=UPI002417AC4A|nr:uncharacterized protein LOC126533280 [Dermacentor andersoni]
MKSPSARAAALCCCACVFYLGPAAAALFQKPGLQHVGGESSRPTSARQGALSRRSSRHGRIEGVLPRGSLGQVGYVPSTACKKRTQVCAQERRNDSVALKLVQTALDKSHRLLLDVAAKMPNLVPRMDAQECLKRTVCEAHNKPGRYGLLGIALQFFFPPFRPGDADDTRMSPLQLAARYGRDPRADCGRQYDGCFVDPLQALQAAVDHFLRRQQAAHSGWAQLSSGGGVVEQSVAAP